ncbi:hypothetical protein EUX98_g9147 [Antrodiella citrinella]|uniref:Integrase catalytic domain-containing protein n=1 Tax=Antrodiella citrinella TaxID=2447956 RepID=A0A4S4LZR7_9APHY|nr:hypothetical protein EUX98_g9147 [Antrodiella citrinella]
MTRASFPPSESGKANEFLGRVHSDLWGPASVQSPAGTRYIITFSDNHSAWVWAYYLRRKSDAFAAFKDWLALVENISGHRLKIFRSDNGGEFINANWIEFMKARGIHWETSSAKTPEQNGVAERLMYTIFDRVRTILINSGLPLFLWTEAVSYVIYTKNRHGSSRLKDTTPHEIRYGPSADDDDDFPSQEHIPSPLSPPFIPHPPIPNPIPPEPSSSHSRNTRPNSPPPTRQRSSRSAAIKSQAKTQQVLSEGKRGPRKQLPAPEATAPAAEASAAQGESIDDHPPSSPPSESALDEPPDPDELVHRVLSHGEEPRSYCEATESADFAEWSDAMDSEHDSISEQRTFELVVPPKGANIITTKWVYRFKLDANSKIIRYKARLVARGFTQKPGVDFDETFAPVAKIESSRLLLALAASLNWEIDVVDVDSAFLNSDMPDDPQIFVRQPEGYVVEGKEHMVWHLLKALYGLKQSGHLWYQKLKSIMIKLGFIVCVADPCVFIRQTPKATSLVSSHVDDLSLICSSRDETALLKSQLRQHVPIKDGSHGQLLGIEYFRNRPARTISLSHRKYIDGILKQYHLDASNVSSAASPLPSGKNLSKDDCPTSNDEKERMRRIPYQNAVGSLNHAAVMTRPDIAYAVHRVAQFSINPGPAHWEAVKHIMRYLKATRDHVLTLGGAVDSSAFTAYCDSDHAGSSDHARSVSGYAILFGAGCFAWSAKKQTATALSTGEAEYYAATHVGREIIWLRELLAELHFPMKIPTPLRIDNTSAISMLHTSDKVTPRTKHIRIWYHWVREEILRRTFAPEHVDTDINVADIFTKPLAGPRQEMLRALLGMQTRQQATSVACAVEGEC